MYILHLPSWTPNENDPLNGNFIDKQIEAISLYTPSITLRLIKDKTKNHTEINKNNPQNNVITKYLKASFWDKIIGIRQLRLYLKGRKSLSAIINQHGKPAFIHLHVAYPYGVIAVDVAKSLHIPLILSEHWSAYLTHFHANKKDDFSPFQRSLIRSVFKNIRGFSAVSHFLLENIQKHYPKVQGVVIPNVVNTDKFRPVQPIKKEKKTILHISTLDDKSKNISGLIRAVSQLAKERNDFILNIIHEKRNKFIEELVQTEHLHSIVHFLGRKNEDEVVSHIQESDFLILFSNYETFGCVIVEAFACGKPVIATNIGALPELVNENRGLLVPVRDEAALCQAMSQMLVSHDKYDSCKLHKYAKEHFSPVKVGQLFADWYQALLSKQQ